MAFLQQGVTLGGTGKEIGDRHPKIGEGALIGASATILGNIKIGRGAMIAACSLVLKDVPPHRWKVISYFQHINASRISQFLIYLQSFESDISFSCSQAWWQEYQQK